MRATRSSGPVSRREWNAIKLFAEREAQDREKLRKKARKTAVVVPIAKAVPKKAAPRTYTTPHKEALREQVLRTYRHGGLLVYTEGPEAEATDFFLHEGKLPKRCLVPVNHDAWACAAIRARTEVRAVHECIFELVKRMRKGRQHVVWLDLETNKASVEDVRAACAVAHTVHLTLTCRAEDPYKVTARADRLLRTAGKRTGFTARYRGVSGISNMVHAVGE